MTAAPTLPDWAEHANAAIARGEYVFPLLDKHRIPVRWGNDATRAPSKVARWALEFPEATGYGIALRADQYVFDADTQEAVDWVRERMPRTYEVGTGRAGGGVHFYFHVPHGRRLRMLNTALGDTLNAGVRGLDGKTKGGYVVGPGSLHKSGTRYAVLEDRRLAALPHKIMQKIGDRPSYAEGEASGGLHDSEVEKYGANASWGYQMRGEALAEMSQTVALLVKFLRMSDEGWSDAFLSAGHRLGIYVASGALSYAEAVDTLEAIFEREDTWGTEGNVRRSIRRGIAHGARREAESWL